MEINFEIVFETWRHHIETSFRPNPSWKIQKLFDKDPFCYLLGHYLVLLPFLEKLLVLYFRPFLIQINPVHGELLYHQVYFLVEPQKLELTHVVWMHERAVLFDRDLILDFNHFSETDFNGGSVDVLDMFGEFFQQLILREKLGKIRACFGLLFPQEGKIIQLVLVQVRSIIAIPEFVVSEILVLTHSRYLSIIVNLLTCCNIPYLNDTLRVVVCQSNKLVVDLLLHQVVFKWVLTEWNNHIQVQAGNDIQRPVGL